jgi:hypothetical protein
MSYWALRIDPSAFRILDWLCAFPWMADDRLIDSWHVPAGSNPQSGDGVFIWVDEGNSDRAASVSKRDSAIPELESEAPPVGAGIYAAGKVTSHQPASHSDSKQTFYTGNNSEAGGTPVPVKYMRLFLGAPMLEGELKANPLLANIPELVRSGDRVYPLSDEQGTAIERAISGRTSMPDNPECHT